MAAITDERIRERAYEIWQREGRPQGREQAHWAQAEAELRGEPGQPAAEPARRGPGKQASGSSPRAGKPKAESPATSRRGPGGKPPGPGAL